LERSHWNLLPPMPETFSALDSGVSSLIAQFLYNRGIREAAQIAAFLKADSSCEGDPWLLPDMQPAVSRLYRAVLGGENIVVYGDYDVDGITATAITVEGLTRLGGRATPYIPHRLNEGYGLNMAALETLARQGTHLVVTVDCGVTAVDQVKKAHRLGMDVIVTDHHMPLEEIPPALAVVNPKRSESRYPFSELAGVGVAYKLLQALFMGLGKEAELPELTDLVALGTIADIMPLLGENRYWARAGLSQIRRMPRLGIREILVRANLEPRNIDADSISWIIAPRLNAAGRLAHAMQSYDLLLTAGALNRAREQILAQGLAPLLVINDNQCPSGIAGLVASRLAEEFHRPTIVMKTGETHCIGSCRSIPELDIMAALRQCHHLLSRYGGHTQAAGFTLPVKHLSNFREQLDGWIATQLMAVDLRAEIEIDAQVDLASLGWDTLKEIQQLAPFGRGNPYPVFLSRGVEVLSCNTMGNGGEHLRMKLRQGKQLWDGVAFRLGNYFSQLTSRMDLVYTLEADTWRGEARLRLNLIDLAPAA
jgi:single-stranded-DNA-specific exonuclease